MKQAFLCIAAICLSSMTLAQSSDYALKPFAFYDSEGNKMEYNQVITESQSADIILFGEHHNDAMIHWIQLRYVKDLMKTNALILGAEFFERDDQLKLDEYTSGLIPARNFEAEARLWKNYKTDYKPLVSLARDSSLTFIATNVPRRYAALVSKSGLDTLRHLSKEARSYLPKLPITFTMETPGYTEMEEMMGGHEMDVSNMVKAQALKDATMAESILKNREKGKIFVHINGDFHSANYGGIYWYIKQKKPKLKVKTIKVFTNKDVDFTPEIIDSGDIILVITEDFSKSY